MEKRNVDLGWANGWNGTPEILQEAMAHDYPVKETFHSSRGETHYRCETDDAIITWKVDSSD